MSYPGICKEKIITNEKSPSGSPCDGIGDKLMKIPYHLSHPSRIKAGRNIKEFLVLGSGFRGLCFK